MTAWDAAAWLKAFRAAGGSVWLHGTELTVGYRMDDYEQQAKARTLYDEHLAEPERRHAIAGALEAEYRVKVTS